eukprot:Skav207771  [mRNA]  locus=scaffold2087:183787:184476:+ [translate_table: standard]
MVDHNHLNRVLALVIASLMIQETMAVPMVEETDGLYFFYGGVFLMSCGAMTVLWMIARMIMIVGTVLGRFWSRTRSGSQQRSDEGATSLSSQTRSGSQQRFDEGATSLSSQTRSGSQQRFDEGATSLSSQTRSGSQQRLGESATSLSSRKKSGSQKHRDSDTASLMWEPHQNFDENNDDGVVPQSPENDMKPRRMNPWNQFQHEFRGRGLNSTTLARMYANSKHKDKTP